MPEPWVVTEISNSAVLREFRGVAAVQGEPLQKTKPRWGNSPRLLFWRDYFFHPLPFPSGARAGAISGVRSTSSGVSSQPTSMRDFS